MDVTAVEIPSGAETHRRPMSFGAMPDRTATTENDFGG
jgi:hypothetical protein